MTGTSTAAEAVREWSARLGRPPRVLHIGNIANNAYLNARILRAAGVDADVLCCDYTHIMGCPEWEDADFSGDYGSDDLPDWGAVDLGGFERPEWFVQGPSTLCLAYVMARQQGRATRAAALRRALTYARTPHLRRAVEPLLALRRRLRARDHRPRRLAGAEAPDHPWRRAEELRAAFLRAFPDRQDRPTVEDLLPLVAAYAPFAAILGHYDVVHAYATQGLMPLVAGRPYVVYEHGTIRGLPFTPSALWQLCALSYRAAAHVFITNPDATHSAVRLGLERTTFVPHPINEFSLEDDDESRALRRRFCADLDTDFIVFHPSRQDWTPARDPVWEKGNDVFLRGFARFIADVNPRASAVLVEWGRTVAATRQLAADLGIAARLHWIRPQPHRRMVRWIHASDVVADQFLAGVFGGITPKALACGRPAMLKFDDAVHRWCFPEPPPVLHAAGETQVCEQLRRIYEQPAFAHDLAQRGRQWYARHHSNEVILERLVGTYLTVAASAAEPAGAIA